MTNADTKKFKCDKCSREFISEEKLRLHETKDHRPLKDDEELDLTAKQIIWDALRSNGTDPGLMKRMDGALSHRATEAKKEQTRSATLSTVAAIAARLSGGDKNEYHRILGSIKPTKHIIESIDVKRIDSKSA